MVVIPCPATCYSEVSFIVIRCVCPFPNIADHVVTTERTDAVPETDDWGRCACTEFCGVASRFVDFVAPREKSIVSPRVQRTATRGTSVVCHRYNRHTPQHLHTLPRRRGDPLCLPDRCRLSNLEEVCVRYPVQTADIVRWLQDRHQSSNPSISSGAFSSPICAVPAGM